MTQENKNKYKISRGHELQINPTRVFLGVQHIQVERNKNQVTLFKEEQELLCLIRLITLKNRQHCLDDDAARFNQVIF